MYSQLTKKTFETIFEKKYILIKALLIPFILLTIIEYFSTIEVKESIGSANYYILIGISFFITIIMSITVHRILLLDDKETPTWGIYQFGVREVTFTLKAIGLSLLLGLLAMLLFFISNLFSLALGSFLGEKGSLIFQIVLFSIIGIFLAMIFSRVSLIFPAIAIDKPMDFTDAFEISKEYKLFLFVFVLIIPIVFAILVGLVYGLAINFLMGLISQNLSVLLSLLNIFITVFTIAFLSTAYEYIMNKQPEKKEEILELEEIEYEEGNNSYRINIDDRYEITFNEIKESLQKQYNQLGFTNIKLDKKDTWMLKNPEIEKAYILLSHSQNKYIVETFNINQKPIIDIE